MEWISVKDRLPDTATDCLVVLYFKDGGEKTCGHSALFRWIVLHVNGRFFYKTHPLDAIT